MCVVFLRVRRTEAGIEGHGIASLKDSWLFTARHLCDHGGSRTQELHGAFLVAGS